MVTQIIIDGVMLFGASMGATGATLIPFYQKLREQQALGETLKFEKKYLTTLVMALVVGVVGAVLSFDQVSAQINPQWTLVKIFIVSAVAAGTSNVTLNRFLSVNGLITQVKSLKAENNKLLAEKLLVENKPIA